MRNSHLLLRHLKSTISGLVFASMSFAASAASLSIVNDQLNVTGTGFAGATPTIAANGIVQSVTNIPDQGDGLSLLNLGFTLEQNGVADGIYTFAFGVMLDDDNSMRRIEMRLPILTFSFTGGVLTGSVAGSQTIDALARNDDNSISVTATITDDGSVLINGSTVTFNAGTLLTRIQASNALFATLIASLNSEAHYTYAVVLKQLSGDTLEFGTGATATFSAYGCITGSQVFQLGGGLSTTFDAGYGLQGQLSFIGASGVPGTAPTAFSASCSTGGGGGGGGGGEEEEVVVVEEQTDESVTEESESINTAIADIDTSGDITDEVTDAIDDALNDIVDLATDTASAIESGNVSGSGAIDVLDTLANALDAAGSATQGGGEIDQTAINDSLSGITDIFDAIVTSNTTLSSVQIDEVQTLTEDTVNSITDLMVSSTSVSETEDLLGNIGNVIDSAISTGASLNNDLFSSAETLVQTALENTLSDIAQALDSSLNITFESITATQMLLSNNTRLLENVLKSISIQLTSSISLNQTTTASALESSGLSENDASSLAADFSQFVNPAGVTRTDDNDNVITAADAIADSILGLVPGGVTLNTSSLTALTTITGANLTVPVNITDTAIVPASIPEGLTTLADGSILSVSDGIASSIIAAPADPIGFSLGFSDIGDVSFNTNGMILISNIGETISGVLGFQNIGSGDGSTGAAEIIEPVGNPLDPSYSYKVNYPDGTSQNLLPFVADDDFDDSLSGRGLNLSTDRSTGVIDVNGIKLKPDYFVQPLTSADTTYLNENQDSTGTAYRRVTDVNGDGVRDYEAISATGVQVIYRVP